MTHFQEFTRNTNFQNYPGLETSSNAKWSTLVHTPVISVWCKVDRCCIILELGVNSSVGWGAGRFLYYSLPVTWSYWFWEAEVRVSPAPVIEIFFWSFSLTLTDKPYKIAYVTVQQGKDCISERFFEYSWIYTRKNSMLLFFFIVLYVNRLASALKLISSISLY